MKNKQIKTEQLLNQTFSTEKFEAKTIKILVQSCLPVQKFNIFLKCLLPYMYPVVYSKCIGSGNQATVKPNQL